MNAVNPKNSPLPIVTARNTLAKSRIFEIEAVELRFANGQERQFERLVSHKPSVMVLPLLDPETALLIREYSTGFNTYEYMLPKGIVDPGEDLLEAANRELQEEVGYAARCIRHMGALALSPAYMTHQTDWLVATDLYAARLLGDEPEPLQVQALSRSDVWQWTQAGKIRDARSLVALLAWTSGYVQ